MAHGQSEGLDFDPRLLADLQVGDPASSKVLFIEIDEWLAELRCELASEPRDMIVRVTRHKNRREEQPICDVFVVAGFHSIDGCLNELGQQTDSVDELGAFKLLDGTNEAIGLMSEVRKGIFAIAEEFGVTIQIRGGRFEN